VKLTLLLAGRIEARRKLRPALFFYIRKTIPASPFLSGYPTAKKVRDALLPSRPDSGRQRTELLP